MKARTRRFIRHHRLNLFDAIGLIIAGLLIGMYFTWGALL